RIDEANGNRVAIHGLEDADKVATLEWQQLVKRFDSRFLGIREDHLLDGALALRSLLRLLKIGEKHVLRTAETDAFRAEFARFAGILRRVSVSANPESTHAIGPFHQSVVGWRQLRRDQLHLTAVDDAFPAIEREPLAFFDCLGAGSHRLGLIV